MFFSGKKEEYIKQNEQLSKEEYRVITVRDDCVNSMDEKDIKKSIKECHKAGIKTIRIIEEIVNLLL